MSGGAAGRAGPLRGRLRARRLRRRVRRAPRREAAARDRAEGARGAREPRASRRRRSRPGHGRRRRHPDADPGRVLPRRRRRRAPALGPLRRRDVLPSRTTPGGGGSSRRRLAAIVAEEGQEIVCWRDVPVDPAFVGRTAAESAPFVRQLVVSAGGAAAADQDAFERKLYVIRRRFELEGGADAIVPSFSSRTIVYKGMLTAPQLRGYYPDLQDERTESALALVHSRFSTNTFPSWELAHPYRMIAHNGEINTVRGNINWMRARESQLASELFGDDLHKVLPVVQSGGSDSATLDNVLELLVLGGRSLPHAMMMMIPEATAGRADLPPELLGFYAYHQCLMEAWDGPAAVSFTDGRVIGSTLDRNGLRPGRWLETRDGWVVLASETGVLDIPAENILRKGRLQPGKLFLVDLEQGRIVPDDEVKRGDRRPAAVRRVVRPRGRAARRPAAADAARDADRVAAPASDRVRLLAGGHEGDPRAARAERRGGGQLDGERHAPRRPLRSPPAHLLLLQAAVRPGHEPADRLDPGGDRDEPAGEHRLREEPLRRDARARPPARARDARSCSTPSSSSCGRCTRRSSRRARST